MKRTLGIILLASVVGFAISRITAPSSSTSSLTPSNTVLHEPVETSTPSKEDEEKAANWQRILDMRAGKILATPTPVSTPVPTATPVPTPTPASMWTAEEEQEYFHPTKAQKAEQARRAPKNNTLKSTVSVFGPHLRIGTVYAVSKEALDQFIHFNVQKDEGAIEELYGQGRISLPTTNEIPVMDVHMEFSGILPTGAESFRIEGHTQTYWVVMEDIRE